jgi:hypothetical protein
MVRICCVLVFGEKKLLGNALTFLCGSGALSLARSPRDQNRSDSLEFLFKLVKSLSIMVIR